MVPVYIAIVIVLLLVAVVAGYVLWRRRRRSAADNAMLPATSRRWFWQRRRSDLANRVRTWVVEQSGDRKLAAWFGELSAAEVRELATELHEFATEMGFDLNWMLAEGKLADDKLDKELRAALVQRLKAQYTAEQMAGNIDAYTRYQKLVANPARNATIIQNLYTELVGRDLAPTTPPEMVMASAAERRTFLVEKIEEAAAKDWAKFATALESALTATQGSDDSSERRRWVPRISLPSVTLPGFLRRNRSEAADGAEASETPATDAPSNDTPPSEPDTPATPSTAPSPA